MDVYRLIVWVIFVVALVGRVSSSGEDVLRQNGEPSSDAVPDAGTNLVEKEDGHSEDSAKAPVVSHATADLDLGEKLLLTELIEAGNISRARDLARVRGTPFPEHITSYSGFFTVDNRYNSNMFFWFFPCQTAYEDAPVLLWLQGGPGDSSLMGLFTEIGPFKITANGTSLEDPNSWYKNHSLLFIDNPVGTGFSFTESDEGYATQHSQIGESLHSAMVQFFKLFPELQRNDFFIAGESYAGKYVPLLAHAIHTKNPNEEVKINLKGIAVGNGFTDPINMIELSELAYQTGLVDSNTRDQLKEMEDEAKRLLLSGEMNTGADVAFSILDKLAHHTKLNYQYNMLQATPPVNITGFTSFINMAAVRKCLHVGNTPFLIMNDGVLTTTFNKLYAVNLESVKPLLEDLLDHYRVMYYSGQMDLVVTYPMSVSMYKTLNWSAKEEYSRAERVPWYVGDDLAGYMKTAGKFTEVLVRNAGHMVPLDQPVWARDLITRFTSNNLPVSDP